MSELAIAQQRVAELAGSKVPELLDPTAFEQWAETVAGIIAIGGRTTSLIAVQSYLLARATAGLSSRYTPEPAAPVTLEQVLASLQWAAGAPEEAEATPRSRAEGFVNRYVLEPARETTIAAATEDPVATTVARVPRVGACAFCLLMAARGDVYHSTAAAGTSANARFVGEGEHKFHDHCRCTVTVVWQGETYEQPEHVQRAADTYAASTGGVDGTAAKLAAYRRAMTDLRA